jgi:hypothetical protein
MRSWPRRMQRTGSPRPRSATHHRPRCCPLAVGLIGLKPCQQRHVPFGPRPGLLGRCGPRFACAGTSRWLLEGVSQPRGIVHPMTSRLGCVDQFGPTACQRREKGSRIRKNLLRFASTNRHSARQLRYIDRSCTARPSARAGSRGPSTSVVAVSYRGVRFPNPPRS